MALRGQQANGKTFLIDGAGETLLKDLIEAKTDLSQRELRAQLAEKTGGVASQPMISRTLQRLNLTLARKKVDTCRRTAQRRRQAGPEELSGRPQNAVDRGYYCRG